MQTLKNLHLHFAGFFKCETIKPFAYLLSKRLSEGHICLDLDASLLDEMNELALSQGKKEFSFLPDCLSSQLVSPGNKDRKPFVLHNGKLYLHRYFHYETLVLEKIRELINKGKEQFEKRCRALEEQRSFIRQLFPGNPGRAGETDWQLVAALCGALNNFTIITGGPGTGKTTTVAKILAILYRTQPAIKVALAAPTGKAASRMAESLRSARISPDQYTAGKFRDMEPSTIHRLLGFVQNSPHFRHNRENPLNYDVVIIDESSMIDIALFARLLDAIGPETRLLMLGDKDQLASVEAGSLFGDLCKAAGKINSFSKEKCGIFNSFIAGETKKIYPENEVKAEHPLFEHIIELRFSHRFSGQEGIGKFSRAVIKNEKKQIAGFLSAPGDEQVLLDTAYSEKVFQDFVLGYGSYIREQDVLTALKKLNRLRVLCAIREGKQGLNTLNQKIENYLKSQRLIFGKGDFYENRPVMITRNDYHHNVFNGETGIIRMDENGVLRAWFEDGNGRLKSVLPGYIQDAETAFAMTIHKSQGSEFNQVLVLLPDTKDVSVITRELLYTAVTRAREKIVIQAGEEIIYNACAASVRRGSGIIDRLKDMSERNVKAGADDLKPVNAY